MDRAPLDAHVVQLQAAQATEGGIMIAGNVDDLTATARQTQHPRHQRLLVLVEHRTLAHRQQVDDIADQIQAFGAHATQ